MLDILRILVVRRSQCCVGVAPILMLRASQNSLRMFPRQFVGNGEEAISRNAISAVHQASGLVTEATPACTFRISLTDPRGYQPSYHLTSWPGVYGFRRHRRVHCRCSGNIWPKDEIRNSLASFIVLKRHPPSSWSPQL